MGDEVNYAGRWAEFVTEVGFADLPGDVVHRMKRSLLDVLGAGVIGSRQRSSRVLLAHVQRQGGTPEASVFPDGLRTTSFNAALANGTHIHATELAESFTRATMHVGNAVLPAALAEAEKQAASGRDLLAAMAVGYEVAIRAGLSVRMDPNSSTFGAKDENRRSGPLGPRAISHPVPTFGIYGATAAAAKLLRLDRERTAQSLTLCTSLTPAIGRHMGFWEGAMAKDLYQGLHNAIAVMSAELAGLGLTGGRDVTNHLDSLVADFEPELLTRGLGTDYLISSGGLHFKLHSTAGMTQSAADAVLDALAKRRVDPAEVEEIEVFVNHRGTRQGSEVDPPSPIAARVSIPYVASAIVTFYDEVQGDPHFTELYSDEKFTSDSRRELARRVKVTGTSEFEKAFEQEWPMKFPGRVRIRLRSGEVVQGDSEIWSVSANLSDQQVIDKFSDLAARVLPRDRVQLAVDKVFAIDGPVTVAEVVRCVCL